MSSQEARRAAVETTVLALLAEQLAVPPGVEDRDTPFLELGANSLVLMEISRAVERHFGVRIPVRQFFADVPTLAALAEAVAQAQPQAQPQAPEAPPALQAPAVLNPPAPVPAAPPQPPVLSTGSADPGSLGDLFARQLRTVSEALNQIVGQQLASLGGGAGSPAGPLGEAVASTVTNAVANTVTTTTATAAPTPGATPVPLPPFRPTELKARGFSPVQQWHLDDLVRRYNGRTARSKSLTQQYRHVLADNRASAGFRFSTKELTYPLVGAGARGSHFRDIDGNDYVDLTMGFGVNLFGHQPDFVKAALTAQLEAGIQIGPQCALAGETAALFTALTGQERVAFCNTGTEAVMAALRLARAVTGRQRVALFEGSYHGQFDGTLGVRSEPGDLHAQPIAAGISPASVADLLILDYGDPASLERLRAHRHELAAVLVEPVQSRRPDLQPREFLQELRALTREAGIILIFDEMISGFRLGPRGAQGFYGIDADLATYGKVLGGGMPIGAVAGAAHLLDAFDGGFWQYGDDSFPAAETTFFAGTFNKHPLTMAAARAVLQHLGEQGPGLQLDLNRRADAFFQRLDGILKAEEAPLSLAWCGSQFRFRVHGNAELFFHHLPDQGIFIWEGRNCFISTAHSEADLARVENAARAALEAMRGGGFLPRPKAATPTPALTPSRAQRLPLTRAQQQLALLAEMDEAGSRAYHVNLLLEFSGPLDAPLLQAGLDALVARHDALRAHLDERGVALRIAPSPLACPFSLTQVAPGDLDTWAAEAIDTPFDLHTAPLLRAHVAQLAPDRHRLLLVAHHLVSDGWSMAVLVEELGEWLRQSGQPNWLNQAAPAWAEVARRADFDIRGEAAEHRQYWQATLGQEALPRLGLHPDLAGDGSRYQAARRQGALGETQVTDLNSFARQQGQTLFIPLLAAWAAVLAQESGNRRLLLGIPVAGRNQPEGDRAVGYLAHLLPLLLNVDLTQDFRSLTAAVKATWMAASAREDYPYAHLLEDLDAQLAPERDGRLAPLVETVFNLDRALSPPDFGPSLSARVVSPPIRHGAYPLALNVLEVPGQPGLSLEADYHPGLFLAEGMDARLTRYQQLLTAALAQPETPLAELLAAPAPASSPTSAYTSALAFTPWDLFAATATRESARVALVSGEQTFTYGALQTWAEHLARQFAAQGLGPGRRLGLALPRGAATVAALLAALRLGASYVPLDPAAPRARLTALAEDAELALVAVAAGAEPEFPESLRRVTVAAQPPLAEGGTELLAPIPVPVPEREAYVLYTSGSTGTPKGVRIAEASLVHLARAQAAALALTADSRCLQSVAFTFDVATGELFAAFAVGAQVVISPTTLPGSELVGLLQDQRITHWQTPVAVLAALPAPLASALPELGCLVVGGEACPPTLARTWSPGRRFLNAYGPTETTVCASLAPIEAAHLPWARLPICSALGEARLYVVDGAGRPCPPGVPGELWIGGPGVALGYLKRPELSAERFAADPFQPGGRLYRSGDRVRQLPDGQLDFLGRLDDQIKLRGQRIEPGEIAQLLAAYPGIREAVVVLRPGVADGDAHLGAYYLTGEAGNHPPPDPEALRAHLRERLPEALLPAFCEHLTAFPLTPHGKVDLAALRARPAPAAAPLAEEAPAAGLETLLAEVFREILGLGPDAPLSRHANFFDLGAHSLKLARAREKIAARLGRPLPITDLFQFPSLARLAAHLEGVSPAAAQPATGRAMTGEAGEAAPIAIIGMAGRFPGADSVARFWQNLVAGEEGIQVLDPATLAAAGVPEALLRQGSYVPARGRLTDIDLFDAGFFGITPREAAHLDPQHRLLLETAWEALEDAAVDPAECPYAVGVFAGVGVNTYFLKHLLLPRLDGGEREAELFELLIGNDKDFAAPRIAYKLNLRGPALAVNSGCSSSLAAVAVACQQIRAGACEMALAGGAAVPANQDEGYLYRPGGIDSPDGHCRAFDAAAAGTVAGSGVGLVVLKRLDLALQDGDPIHGVIVGVGMDNDGADKVGFTAPSVAGQRRAISAALADAGLRPRDIGYVEAHGTGTPLGDPIEVAALHEAFRPAPGETALAPGACVLGAVKTSVGHLDTAAGVTGLIKTTLAVQEGVLPATLHFRTPHPALGLEQGPFRILPETTPWPPGPGKRRAGVSSFGIGGTNVHLVVEEAPATGFAVIDSTATDSTATDSAAPSQQGLPRLPQLLPLSARSPASLALLARRLKDHLAAHPALDLAAVAHTLQSGRRAFPHRASLVAATPDETQASLATLLSQLQGAGEGQAPGQGEASVSEPPPELILVFPGQGSQHPGMGQGFLTQLPVFREVFERCALAVAPVLGSDLRECLALTPAPEGDGMSASTPTLAPTLAQTLAQTRLAQPLVFSFSVALAAQLQAWGLQARALVGHSLGELAAACVAGVFTPEQGARLIAERGRLMQAMAPGTMLSVALSEAAVSELLAARPGQAGLSLAAVNGPDQCVLSGPGEAIESLEASLASQGIPCRRLRTSHAFHSPMMAEAAREFAALLATVPLSPPRLPFLSNRSGTWITAAEATDPAYWADQMLQPVRFAANLATLSAHHRGALALECGPGSSLTALVRRQGGLRALACQPSAGTGADSSASSNQSTLSTLLGAVGQLWQGGLTVHWPALAGHEKGQPPRRVHLPATPFERQRHWVDPARIGQPLALDPLTNRATNQAQRLPADQWIQVATWRPDPVISLSTGLTAGLTLSTPGPLQWVTLAGERPVVPGLSCTPPTPDTLAAGTLVLQAEVTEEEDAMAAFLAAIPWCQGLAAQGPGRVLLLTRGAFSTLDEINPAAPAALLLGLIRTLPREYPGLEAGLLDLAPGDSPEQDARAVAVSLSHPPIALTAWRRGRRWLPGREVVSFATAPATAPSPSPFPDQPVLWLIGGSGRIGLTLAETLLRRYPGAHLVLSSRHPERLPAAPRQTLEDLAQAQGATLQTLPADVAAPDDHPQGLQATARALLRQHGRLDGVIYAAGLVGEGALASLEQVDKPRLEALLAAKDQGPVRLAQALAATLGAKAEEVPVQLMSSLAAETGGALLAAYAGANACLDARVAAHNRHHPGANWLSLAWDGWAEPGMAAGDHEFTVAEAQSLYAQVLDLLGRGLRTDRLILSPRDLSTPAAPARARQGSGATVKPLEAAAETLALPPSLTGPGDDPQADPVLAGIAAIWYGVLGVSAQGPTDNFFSLGGDSLVAVQVAARLRERFGVEVPVRHIFEYPTLGALANAVKAQRDQEAREEGVI